MGLRDRSDTGGTEGPETPKTGRHAAICVATDGYDILWDFCIRTQRDYCARHAIDYHLVTECDDGQDARSAAFLEAIRLLEAGLTVLVLHADVQISQSAPHFAAAMNADDKDIYIADGVSGHSNAGVMMLRGRVSILFLKACLATGKTAGYSTAEGKNAHIGEILEGQAFSDARQVLPVEWNCTSVKWAGEAHFLHYAARLGRALDNAEWLTGFELSNSARTPADARAQAEWELHRLSLRETARLISWNRSLKRDFKKSVRMMSGELQCPDMPKDTVRGWIWRYEFLTGLLERPTAMLFQRLLQDSSVFIDGGANAGYFSILAAHAATTGKILAIEPHPDVFRVLEANLAGTTAICVQTAISDKPGTLELFQGDGHSSSTIWEIEGKAKRRIPVQVTTIDDLVREHALGPVEFIKIDIEGAEALAIEGARNTLEDAPDIVVVMEANPALLEAGGTTVANLMREMRARGFIGRVVRDDFRLGPPGFVPAKTTSNVVFAREKRWRQIAKHLRN